MNEVLDLNLIRKINVRSVKAAEKSELHRCQMRVRT